MRPPDIKKNDLNDETETRHRNADLGWHADDEPIHGSIDKPFTVLSLSLGSTRTFLVQRTSENVRGRIVDVPMREGDLLAMTGLFQKEMKHK